MTHWSASVGRSMIGAAAAELDRQRLDDLDLRVDESGQHLGQVVVAARTRLHADAVARLRAVADAQGVVLRFDLFGLGGDGCFGAPSLASFQELERHVAYLLGVCGFGQW